MADNNPFLDAFRQFGANMKLPSVDVTEIVDYHKRNIEAMQESARVVSSGTQEIMERQREDLRETLADITQMFQNFDLSKGPGEMSARQMEFNRRAFERTVESSTEVARIMRESGTKNFEIMRERAKENAEAISRSISGITK